ncbi:MAG: hypothetical protein KDD11_23990 [Acidobacteria bacterium]|nr:hypothetical protein [Acidobacteriota bacterium]
MAILLVAAPRADGRDRQPTGTGRPGLPTAVTVEMQAWAHHAVAGVEDDLSRLRALHGPLTREGAQKVHEILGPTPTAALAFASRRADCVGFALLLVTLARSVGIDAGYVLVATEQPAAGLGSLRVLRSHLAVTFADRVFDLAGEEAFVPARHHRILDRSALAVFYSNRGAQELASGHAAEAVDFLWQALRLDPSLGPVWSNLGVALRRSGDAAGAVLAHEMALRLDPGDANALLNLSIARADTDSAP